MGYKSAPRPLERTMRQAAWQRDAVPVAACHAGNAARDTQLAERSVKSGIWAWETPPGAHSFASVVSKAACCCGVFRLLHIKYRMMCRGHGFGPRTRWPWHTVHGIMVQNQSCATGTGALAHPLTCGNGAFDTLNAECMCATGTGALAHPGNLDMPGSAPRVQMELAPTDTLSKWN